MGKEGTDQSAYDHYKHEHADHKKKQKGEGLRGTWFNNIKYSHLDQFPIGPLQQSAKSSLLLSPCANTVITLHNFPRLLL